LCLPLLDRIGGFHYPEIPLWFFPGERTMSDEDEPEGFSEKPQSGFSTSGDIHIAFYRFVLTAYSYRCAISGKRFPPQDGILHPSLDVVAIHPLELHGSLEVSNALVLETGLGAAFRQGYLAISDDYTVIATQPEALTEDEMGSIEPGRTLFLPEDPLFHPSKKHLHFHRLVLARYQH
jgi:predicted restriction endonuclease